MKVFKISLGFIVGLVLLLLLGSLWLPSQWQVERSMRIKAVPAEVFPYVNNLTKWPEWTVWYQGEPQPVTRYSGPESGVGAMSEWQDASGQGEMAITVSVPDWGMTYNLSFEHGEFTAHGEISGRSTCHALFSAGFFSLTGAILTISFLGGSDFFGNSAIGSGLGAIVFGAFASCVHAL